MLFTLSSFLKYLDLCPKCFLFWGQKKHHPVKSGANLVVWALLMDAPFLTFPKFSVWYSRTYRTLGELSDPWQQKGSPQY